MSYIKETVNCPKCHSKIRAKIYHELTLDDLEKIYTMDFLKITCSNCHETIILNYDMSFKTDDYHVFYVSDNKEIVDKFRISRITKTHDDFKEKILMLSDNLNDFVITFLKCFVHDDMNLASFDNFRELRYNEISDDGIIFYVVGMDKYLKVPMERYNNVLKRSKIKKCMNAILVDELTFRQYMKVK